MKNTKVIFMGTPTFAVPILEYLIDATNVIAVFTQPDKEVGRKHEIKSSPIKLSAQKHHIPIFQPEHIKEEQDTIRKLQPDIIITCAYGQMIPEMILEIPPLKSINVHASLLPKLRGGAPIHHAIINGEEKTGITIMYMAKKMDAGDIIAEKECSIKDTDNVGILHDKLSQLGKELLKEILPSIIAKTNPRIPQKEEDATYAFNITREDEHINFNKSAKEIYNQVRGLNPWPKAYTIINEEEIKIIECFISNEISSLSSGTISKIKKDAIGVCTKDNVIYITKLKPFGKKEMSALDYINGINKEKILHTICE